MEVRINKTGLKTYKEKIYLLNGKTKTKTFKRKSDAVIWKKQAESERDKNVALGIAPLKDNLLFFEVFEIWMQRKVRPSKSLKTISDYQSIGNKHLKSFLLNTRIRSIERSHGDHLVQVLKEANLSNKTANKIIMVFKQVMSFAEATGYLNKNPVKNVSLLKLPDSRIEYLSQQESLQLLRSNVHHSTYPLLVVALNTGMRIGELTGLCWDRLNFENDTIEVSRTLSRKGLRDSTKTNLIRHIPMNAEVKIVLQNILRKQISPRFVFVDDTGNPFNPDHYSQRYFQKSLERAGVRKVKFHDLRHTYASHFMMNGGNIYDLQKILGHTKVEMTMKYAHLSPQHLRKVVDTVRLSAEGDKSSSPFLAPQEKYNQPMVIA